MRTYFVTLAMLSLLQACSKAPSRISLHDSGGQTECDGIANCDPTNPDGSGDQSVKSPGFGLARIWRLSPIQMNNTLSVLFNKKDLNIVDKFGAETRPAKGYGTDSDTLKFDSTYTASLNSIIADLLKDPKNILSYTSCTTFEALSDACVAEFTKTFGSKAFRRELSEDELTRYTTLFTTVKKGLDNTEALTAVAEAIVRSPYTNFRFELGDKANGLRALTGPELATALAFATTNSLPDDKLLELGKSGELLKADVYAAEVDRNMAKPEFNELFTEFLLRFTGVEWLPNLKKQGAYPLYTDAVSAALVQEVKAYIKTNLEKDKASYKLLLSSTKTTITPPLADIYGIDKFTEAKAYDFNPAERIGIMNLPGVISANSPADHSGPVQRGIFVLQKFMCAPPPPPSADVSTELPEAEGKSVREIFAAHESDAACAGCHKLIDPPGFAYETFDAIGRFRAQDDHGAPVFSEGSILLDNKQVAFKNSAELASKFVESPKVHSCFVDNAFDFVFGRGSNANDKVTLASAKQAFTDSALDMRSVFKSFYLSDTFRYRTGE